MKQLICFLFGHKWTSKAMKDEKPSGPLNIDSFRDYAKMYCDRCGRVSKLNDRL
jgi:hypothetical protein